MLSHVRQKPYDSLIPHNKNPTDGLQITFRNLEKSGYPGLHWPVHCAWIQKRKSVASWGKYFHLNSYISSGDDLVAKSCNILSPTIKPCPLALICSKYSCIMTLSAHSYIWCHVHLLFNYFLLQLQSAYNSKWCSAFYIHLLVMDILLIFVWKATHFKHRNHVWKLVQHPNLVSLPFNNGRNIG